MIDKNTIYSYFQTDDFPTEEQFRATWDSYWHKSESIPMSQITGLNQLFQQTATVAQLNGKANVDGSNIDVSAYQEKLNITNLIATAKEEVKTELLNGAPEAFDTLKEISDWISDDETAEAAILQAIQNEATARTNADNQKLDKGTYTGTAQDLYNRFEGKIDAGYNSIPKVGNGASGKVMVDSVVSEIYGKIGIGLAGEASEKLEVGGNIKAIDFKGNSVKFELPSALTPTPNTLVPKTDGSGLVWYDNNSVPKDLGNSGGSGEKLDKFSKIENITVSQDTNYIYIKGDVLHVIKNGEMGNTTPGSAKITLNGYLEITNGILIEKTDTINNPGHNSGVGGFNFMPYDETIYYKGLYIGFYIRIDKSINPSPFWTNGYGVVCIMLTYADYVGSSKAIGAIRL